MKTITVSTKDWKVEKVLEERQIEIIEIDEDFHLLLKRDKEGFYIPRFYIALNMFKNTSWDTVEEITEEQAKDIKIQITEIGKIEEA